VVFPCSADARALSRTRTATAGKLTATPPGAGTPQAASDHPLDHTEERLNVTIGDADLAGWTCPGQLDALTVLPACLACGAAVDATAHGPACRNPACSDPWRCSSGPIQAAEEVA
jgi:hypothetical protein